MLPVLVTRDLTLIVLCLGGAFFFAEIVIGPMWAIPMDIAPTFSGTASGLMNTGSALAAILSPQIFGIIVDHTKQLAAAFRRIARPPARRRRARLHHAPGASV